MSERNILKKENIASHIYFIRARSVILDFDLAMLYGVETKQLKRAVRRNIKRFPTDFMFQLTKKELENLRCQIGTSSWGGVRYLPFAFTEQGVAMLSGVLNSDKAIKVNIAIMRTFVQIRTWMSAHKELEKKFRELEVKYDKRLQIVFETIKELIKEEKKPHTPIGFKKRNKLDQNGTIIKK